MKWEVLIHHQKHSLCKMAYQTCLYPCSVNSLLPNRHFAAAATKPARKIKKGAKEKTSDEKPVYDIEKIKSYTYMASDPEDDVYLKRLYPRRIYEVETAIHLLKKFQVLDFTNPKQGVYLDLTLDMALGKKKKVEPFTSVIALPHPFSSEVNKVAVFTGNASEIKIAEENGAAFAGGTDLVTKILDDEVVVDFYVAVPEVMGELNPLKKKLKKRFPKATRNSVGRDIPKMLELFKTAQEIMVDEERQNFLSTKIATAKETRRGSEHLPSKPGIFKVPWRPPETRGGLKDYRNEGSGLGSWTRCSSNCRSGFRALMEHEWTLLPLAILLLGLPLPFPSFLKGPGGSSKQHMRKHPATQGRKREEENCLHNPQTL
ncbi:large ribosomal subunit protein uL1m isoform X2 [Arvicanthis niloticus]|uniref:large ribosomal subunit protein uL1m isoform X2 n=1 Tax=Arvicanthis niloticus TaxID=61156 RepID=UPI00402B46DE